MAHNHYSVNKSFNSLITKLMLDQIRAVKLITTYRKTGYRSVEIANV
jgi:aryl carrier-like protein